MRWCIIMVMIGLVSSEAEIEGLRAKWVLNFCKSSAKRWMADPTEGEIVHSWRGRPEHGLRDTHPITSHLRLPLPMPVRHPLRRQPTLPLGLLRKNMTHCGAEG